MSLKINRIKLLVSTLNGDYGADLGFGDGLVLLHKDNTKGKSTALKAIVYALGLERMFGPIDQPPLPPAMTTTLKDGGDEWPVSESWVLLEMSNRKGRTVTLRRKVAGEGGKDKKLIEMWNSDMSSVTDSTEAPLAFYARDRGSASREQGIYVFLSDFIGWTLPDVVRFDGSSSLLYIECLMSLFFVEQSQGWTGIQAGIPRYLQIRNIEKRAIEFLLDLDAGKMDGLRQKLEQEEKAISAKWFSFRTSLERLSSSIGGVVRDLPDSPIPDWPLDPLPHLETYFEGKEISLARALALYEEILTSLTEDVIPTADQAAERNRRELDDAFNELRTAELLSNEIQQEIGLEISNLESLNTRKSAMLEDLDHYRGERKIRELGFTKNLMIASGECPTCHQQIDDLLLDQKGHQHIMTVDENIAYLEAQVSTVAHISERTTGAIDALGRRKLAVDNHVSDLLGTIRAIKRTLASEGTALSEEFVRKKLILEERLEKGRVAEQSFLENMPRFQELSREWQKVQLAKSNLKEESISPKDREKLDYLEALFLSALGDFGFSSFPIKTISLDRKSYKPTRQGFDVSYDVSASDNIRVISAYLIALLEVGRRYETNHPGILVLDEPRQQNMKWSDFTKVLERLSNVNSEGQQAIVATSDQPDRIEEMAAHVSFSKVKEVFGLALLRKV